MDPLSDVLSLLKPRSYAFRGLDAAGDWALAFPPGPGIRCYAILTGHCWLQLTGDQQPVVLQAGDFVLLTQGHAFRLGSGTKVEPIDALTFFSAVKAGDIATLNGGGDCTGIGGYFAFQSSHAGLLLDPLPPVLHFQTEADRATLRWLLNRLMQELRTPQPGGWLVAEHLAQGLLIQALRLHLVEGSLNGTGWLFALANSQMSAAIAAMHTDPGRRWTLESLGKVAGMSRSAFAARFRTIVGEPAMAYLTRWRMLVAADRLTNGRTTLAKLAPSLGYESESAFGAAFKRELGCSPRQFVSSLPAL